MRVAVAGGTGVSGAALVDALTMRGHETVVLARSAGADLLNPGGLADRLSGCDVVVDLTNPGTQSERRATAFFTTVTENLLAAEAAAGVGHHVLLSIVGIDDVPSGYYLAKLAQERLVTAGDVPWTVMRATQFHEFAADILGRLRVGRLQFAPRARFQTIAVRELAQMLADVTLAPAAGRTPDVAGPIAQSADELAREFVAARFGGRGRVVRVPIPGRGGRAIAAGGLVPSRPGPRGAQTFAQWLGESDR